MVYKSCDPNDVYCESSLSTLGRESVASKEIKRERERKMKKKKREKLEVVESRRPPVFLYACVCWAEISRITPVISRTMESE